MQHVLLTGSSRGIGLATAKAFLKHQSYRVIGTSTSGATAWSHERYRHLKLRLDRQNSLQAAVENILAMDIRLDGIINNAAVLLEDWDNAQIDMDQLKQTFAVNVFGTVALTESLIPLLRPGAHIINVSSGWGTFSDRNFDEYQPHYKMSKAALNMYTKLLASRLKPKEVIVSALDPGWVRTDMGTQQASTSPEKVAEEILALFEKKVESGRLWYRSRPRDW